MAILTMVIKKVENLGGGIAFNIEYRKEEYLLIINDYGMCWSQESEKYAHGGLAYAPVPAEEAKTLNRAWSKVKFLP